MFELAIGLFAGLVLFAAFGRQSAELLRGISPALALLAAKLLRVAGVVAMVVAWGFTALAVSEMMGKKEPEEGQAIVVGLVGITAGFLAVWLGYFAAGVMEVATAVAVAPAEEEEEEDEEPVSRPKLKRKKTPPSAQVKALPAPTLGPGVFEARDDDDATWVVNLDDMALTQGHLSYRMRRTPEGRWQVRNESRDWIEIDECLETVIDTRWRRYVGGKLGRTTKRRARP